MRLTEAVEALLLATRADGRSRATVQDYRRKLTPLADFLGDVDTGAVTVQDLRCYIADLQDRPVRWVDHPHLEPKAGQLSPFSVASHVRAIKRLFNWLEAEGEIDANPTRRIRTPHPQRTEPKAIALDDLLAILDTTKGPELADMRDRAILLFLADTGCRVSGLCGLRIEQVDLGRGLALVTEKGAKSRFAPFSAMTAEALRDWLAIRPEGPGSWVFLSLGNKAEGRLSANGVRQMLRRRAKKAGVTGRVNPHAFRHGFAREYLMSGGDLASLADLMGHSSVEVTKASYAIFTVKELQEKHRRHSPVARLGNDKVGS